MSVKEQAVKGIFWNTIERFSSQGIQLILTILIARILSPSDYGLVAMLGVFMAIAQTLVDNGFYNALVQHNQCTQVDYNTAFLFNLLLAILVYLALYLFSPLIASFYHQPQLVKITRYYSLVLIFNALSIVQRARLTIMLDFKKQAFASLYAVILSGLIGIYMAYLNLGVWALVGQSLSLSFFFSLFLWIYAKWHPTFVFSLVSFHRLFSFGSKLMLTGMLQTIYVNMYSLLIGKYFKPNMLGYFNRAYSLGQFPVQNYSSIMLRVLYPILCRYQNDQEKFSKVFLDYLRLSVFILFPVMIGFAVLAKPLIVLLLTDKWSPCIPLLQIICFSQMWDPIMKFNSVVLDAKGKANYRLSSEIIKKAAAFSILFFSLSFGLTAMCWGLALYSLVDILIIIGYSRKVMSIGYLKQFESIWPVLLLSVSVGGLVYLLLMFIDGKYAQLLLGAIVGILLYIAGSYLFCREEWKLLKKLLETIKAMKR